MSLLTFSPILALVALLSIEVAAESFKMYSQLADGGYINGFNYTFTVNTEEPYTISTTGDEQGCLASELGTCPYQPATWDNRNTIDVVANIPETVAFPDGMTPETVEFRMCFSPSSQVDRKWRKIKDIFKKDNSCKNGAKESVEWATGEVRAQLKLKSITPTALYTIRAYVSCDGNASNEYCHVVNYLTKDDTAPGEGRVYVNTEVMDSRPNNLFVAVIICALIGPIMLAAFLVYERGILTKQA